MDVDIPTIDMNADVRFIECKFSVASDEMTGGDWEKNIGGMRKKTRIDFDGFCSKELYGALANAIKKVVGE